MKLIELQIHNFRGLSGENNIISFDNTDLIFLIGNNNNGKSTFLHAYNFFTNPKTKPTIDDFHNKSTDSPIIITAKYKQENKDDEPSWISDWADSNGIITIKKEWYTFGVEGKKYTYDSKLHSFVAGGFGGFDSLLTTYSPTAIFINAINSIEDLEKEINDIISKNHIKKLKDDYKEQHDSIVDALNDLKNKITSSEDICKLQENINAQFKKIFPKLDLNIYSKAEEGIDITKTLKSTHGFEIKDGLNNIDINQNGHGVLRQALFSFLSSKEAKDGNYIILFEEPELYLHPKTISILKDELYKLSSNENCQVLCATHSPSMIDLSKSHSSLVRLVKHPETNITSTHQVNLDIFKDEEKDQLQMINRFNPHICEAFYSDEIILVEGDTEAIIYRELISNYFKNNNREIFILNTGSKSNMVFYQKILTHFAIKHTIVHDSDSKFTDKKKEDSDDYKINPMWSVNERIWEQIEKTNLIIPNLAKRFVHFNNFEEEHSYKYDKNLGKPLSAYNFAKNITCITNSKHSCIKFLNDLFGENIINITQEQLLANVK